MIEKVWKLESDLCRWTGQNRISEKEETKTE